MLFWLCCSEKEQLLQALTLCACGRQVQTVLLRLNWNSQQDLALALAESVCPDAWLRLLAESLCPDAALSGLLHKAAGVGHSYVTVK